MKVVIRLKSGFELTVTCEGFKITTNSLSGEITGYDIKGIKDNKPLFLRSEDVECIYRILDGERKDNDPDD